jgi:hypothetical protein
MNKCKPKNLKRNLSIRFNNWSDSCASFGWELTEHRCSSAASPEKAGGWGVPCRLDQRTRTWLVLRSLESLGKHLVSCLGSEFSTGLYWLLTDLWYNFQYLMYNAFFTTKNKHLTIRYFHNIDYWRALIKDPLFIIACSLFILKDG